jgi:uncharacterized protein
MRLMTKVVVADTGPLIALALLDLLPVLSRLFSTIYVPDGVICEATHDVTRPGARAILNAVENNHIVCQSITISDAYLDLAELLDKGEAEALALAEQLDAIALVDERRGRKVAIRRGIALTGTAAVLIKAKRAGEIAAVKPLLRELAKSGYRLSNKLVDDVLKLSGEYD